MKRPYVLLGIGALLALHWLPFLYALARLDTYVTWGGSIAWSLLVLCLAALVVGRVEGRGC